eukprot:986901-Heterocapsa_arctica.AAC.1
MGPTDGSPARGGPLSRHVLPSDSSTSLEPRVSPPIPDSGGEVPQRKSPPPTEPQALSPA